MSSDQDAVSKSPQGRVTPDLWKRSTMFDASVVFAPLTEGPFFKGRRFATSGWDGGDQRVEVRESGTDVAPGEVPDPSVIDLEEAHRREVRRVPMSNQCVVFAGTSRRSPAVHRTAWTLPSMWR